MISSLELIMNQDIVAYYRDRAAEYEAVYSIPEEQDDLKTSADLFRGLLAGKTVLEIACGTGWWTERIGRVAESVLATDVNESVIAIAKEKKLGPNVSFEVADMFDFATDDKFDAVFCGFIWSHILLEDLDRFIARIRGFVKPGGLIVFIDGNPVEGTKHDLKRIARTDGKGNTFQNRTLRDGSTHLVLKNFPDADFIRTKLSAVCRELKYTKLRYYWIAICESVQP